jgi:inner membrane protease ATP23
MEEPNETLRKQHTKCEKVKEKLIGTSSILKFLLKELDSVGGFNLDSIKCMPCNPSRAGGFAPKKGIVLCENMFVSDSHMEQTLSHELIHAYDEATVDIDWTNKRHLDCTEIRGKKVA